MPGHHRAEQRGQAATAHQRGRIHPQSQRHLPLKLALDQRRHQCLNQRYTGAAQQGRDEQHFSLMPQQAPQARAQNHQQAQRHAPSLAQTGFYAHPEQGHQPHANHRQAGQPGAALKAHAGVATNLHQQWADGTQNRPQVKPQCDDQGPTCQAAQTGFSERHGAPASFHRPQPLRAAADVARSGAARSMATPVAGRSPP